jgi:hypothetical protein
MIKFWTFIKYVAGFFLAAVSTLYLVSVTLLRFRNPKMTETELFLEYWEYLPVIVILVGLTILGFSKTDE